MTRKTAERITGLDMDRIQFSIASPGHKFIVDDGGAVLFRKAVKLKEELSNLVEAVYTHRRGIAMARQGHRCFATGAFTSLECDHCTPRARGRDDRVENLRMLAHDQHRMRHSGIKLEIHPLIEKIARSNGWDWDKETNQWKRIPSPKA